MEAGVSRVSRDGKQGKQGWTRLSQKSKVPVSELQFLGLREEDPIQCSEIAAKAYNSSSSKAAHGTTDNVPTISVRVLFFPKVRTVTSTVALPFAGAFWGTRTMTTSAP
jgi:hypothetical protein